MNHLIVPDNPRKIYNKNQIAYSIIEDTSRW